MCQQRRNVLELYRTFQGHTVRIKAEYIERLSLYGLVIKMDGQLWDCRTADDVLAEAEEIFSEAYEELMPEEQEV